MIHSQPETMPKGAAKQKKGWGLTELARKKASFLIAFGRSPSACAVACADVSIIHSQPESPTMPKGAAKQTDKAAGKKPANAIAKSSRKPKDA